jgi:hypothetical protein
MLSPQSGCLSMFQHDWVMLETKFRNQGLLSGGLTGG